MTDLLLFVYVISDLVVIVNQFGIDTCLVLPLTNVMALEIHVHQLLYLVAPTLKMSL